MDEPANDIFANVDEPITDYFEKLKLGHSVGLKTLTQIDKYKHELTRLKQYAESKGAKNIAEIVFEVKKLANRVGSPTIGDDWAKHLSTYAYLEMQKEDIDKELKVIAPKAQEENDNPENTDSTT